MSAGTNVAIPATPIDLETVRRNLREVMTNLHLLENGENIRVEDLIRQARENLDRNRRFILQNIGPNPGNHNIVNIRNDNRVLAVHLERLPEVHQLQPVAADEQLPRRENRVNNAIGHVDRNEGGIEQRNLRNNGDNDVLENPLRAWAERYERDWLDFRQNRPNDGGNFRQNIQNNSANPRANPCVIRVRLNNDAVNNNAGQNRINGDNNGNIGARARPGNFELPRCLLGSIGRRPTGRPGGPAGGPGGPAGGQGGPAGGPGGPNIYPLAAANPGLLRYNNNANRALRVAPPPNRLRLNRGPAAPERNVDNLEERITFLQNRLDRLEDNRFYEYMIQGGGQDRIRRMIRGLRQELQHENVANANANLNRMTNVNANNPRRNPPNAELNQDNPHQPGEPLQRLEMPGSIPRTTDQPINQQNPAMKRPSVAETSGQTNVTKRLRGETNLGFNPIPPPPKRNNDSSVAGCSNQRENSSVVVQGSAQDASENILMTAAENNVDQPQASERETKHKNQKHSKKGKNKAYPNKSNQDDQRPGPSRERFDPQIINRNIERFDIENGTDNPRLDSNNTFDDSVRDDPDVGVETVENTPRNEENPQDVNADVIIVSAFFPVRVKVERNDDDDNDQNNRPNQANVAQNRADPPVIPRNDNEVRHDEPRRPPGFPVLFPGVPLGGFGLANQMPPPAVPGPVLRAPLENGGEARRLPARIVDLARALINDHPEARGPGFLGIGERSFLTMENIVAGLQNFVLNEARAGNQRLLHVQENEREEHQLRMIQTYVRLRKELREIIYNTERLGMRSYEISIINGKIILCLKIVGPPGTAYDRADIGIKVSTNAWAHSEVCMAQRTWHPNMCPFTGDILPIFPWTNWTLFKIVACIRRLLIIPELENTTHDVVSQQFQTNRDVFNRTAQHWTSVYGGGRNDHLAIPEYAELLERLVEEGIPKDRALHLLSKNNWDIDRAMEEVG